MGSTVGSKSQLVPGKDIAFRDTPDGGVLVNLGSGACFRLNRVAADLWNLLAQGKTIEEAARKLAARYSFPLPTVEADALDLIRDLLARELVSARTDGDPGQ